MADEVVIKFKADGGNLDATLRQLRDELGKLGGSNAPKSLRDTSAATTQLAQALGGSFKNAQQFTRELGLTAQKSAEAVNKLRDLDRVGASNAEKFRALSREMGITRAQFEQLNTAAGKSKEGLTGLAAASGAIAAGLGVVGATGIKTFADFDKAIRTFGVVTQSTGTAALGELRGEVERLSAATTKTPQEIAEVAVELGKAGFTAEQTKIALAGVVQSSEATGEGLARTGEVIGATLNQFGLSADKSLKIADLLTQASNASAAGTNDLGEALSYVGSQAAGSNQSIEDTVTTLALLANAGIKGSSAGTGLAEALKRLKIASASATTELTDLRSKGSKSAVAAFERLNNEVRDSEGKLLPFPEIIKKLKGSLTSLGEVDKDLLLNSLFGIQGGRIIQTLLGQTDAQIAQVTGSMADFQGASAKASGELTKGLGSSLTLFGSSLSLGTQKIGEFLAVGVEPLVRGATALLGGFLALPTPVQALIVGVGGLTAILATATAVLTAYQLLNVATTAALTLKTAATIASTVATGAGSAAQLLFNTQITVASARLAALAAAQGLATIAQQAYAAATTGAAGASQAFAASLLTVVAPLAALGAGVALVGVVKFTEALGDQNNTLEELRASTDAVLGAGLNAQTRLKAAIDAQNTARAKGIALTQEQIEAEKRAKAQADQTLTLLKQQLDQAEKTPKAQAGFGGFGQEEADAQNRTRDTNIAAIKNQIRALEDQKKALQGNTEAAKANNKVLADPKAKTAEEKTDLKADREEQQQKAQQSFQDQQQQKEQSFQDAKQAREQAFQDQKAEAEQAFQDQKQAAEQSFADEQAAREQAFQDSKQTREATFADQQRQKEQAFQDQQKAAQEAFQEGQRQKQDAFNKSQQASQEAFSKKQSDEKRAFDESLSGEEKALDRRQQLRGADTPEAKANLRKQFREQDREEKEREPLEEKRRAFEEKQKAEAKAEQERLEAEKKAFEEAAKAEQVAFEATQKEQARLFQEEQRAIEVAFKQQEREADRSFKAEQQAQERIFKAEQQEKDKAFKLEQQAADRTFKSEEQAKERAFKAEQQAADRAFKQTQREFDLETARQVKAIAESTKPPEATPTTPDKPGTTPAAKVPGRRLGGPVDGGSLYQVGESGPEYFVPSQNGFVIKHNEAIALAREALGSRSAIPTVNLAPASNDAMLSEMRATRRVMEKIESRELQANFPVSFEGAKTEENYDRYYRWGRSLMRGMM